MEERREPGDIGAGQGPRREKGEQDRVQEEMRGGADKRERSRRREEDKIVERNIRRRERRNR